jgi:hypothetical protein
MENVKGQACSPGDCTSEQGTPRIAVEVGCGVYPWIVLLAGGVGVKFIYDTV